MELTLDRTSAVSLKEQIASLIQDRIRSGELAPGARLLSSRDLADRLKVNRATVVDSYRFLMERGWIESGVGRGTFVRQPPGAPRPGTAAPDPLRWLELLPRGSDPAAPPAAHPPPERELVPLSRAVAHPGMFPVAEVEAALRAALESEREKLFEYASPAGYEPLRQALMRRFAEHGVDPERNDVLIVNGSQQGLDLVARLFLRDGGAVLTSKPSFAGALDVFRWYGSRMLSVPVDAGGMDVEAAARVVERNRPRLVYTIPTFHNPTGVVLAEDRRQLLLDLAARHQFPVLEDDWLSSLGDTSWPEALKCRDPANCVMYLGTLSKVLVPGLRVGWLVVPREIFGPLVSLKQRTDLATNLPGQAAVHRLLEDGFFTEHVQRLRARLEERRIQVDRTIDDCFPEEARPLRPHHGMVLWISLPPHVEVSRVVEAARQEGVDITAGAPFDPTDGSIAGFRISYATAADQDLVPALRRLGQALHQVLRGGVAVQDRPPLV